jgi:hypothetical protein
MNTQTDQQHSARRGTEEIVDGVGEVVNATLELVGDLARRGAEATAPRERPVTPPSGDAPPLNVVVHYGIATVTNMIELFGGAVRDVATMNRPSARQPRPGAPGAAAMRPTVKPGGTLRIPLSIENPDTAAMDDLGFVTLDMRHRGAGHGRRLDTDAVRFEPETLTIAPHDFEKLTLYIEIPENTAPGRYEAVIGLGGTSQEMSVRFDVVS